MEQVSGFSVIEEPISFKGRLEDPKDIIFIEERK